MHYPVVARNCRIPELFQDKSGYDRRLREPSSRKIQFVDVLGNRQLIHGVRHGQGIDLEKIWVS